MVELQRTLVLVKPDAMQRGLAGEIISRLERRGLRIVGMKLIAVPRALAEEHYAEHKGKGFYSGLVEYICSSPILAAVFEGPSAVKAVRQTVGKTNPVEAMPGTIRADLGLDRGSPVADYPAAGGMGYPLRGGSVESVTLSLPE